MMKLTSRKLLGILLALALLFALVPGLSGTAQAAGTVTVTWNDGDIAGSGNSFTRDGVTVTAGAIDFTEKNFTGGGTFTTERGSFTAIQVSDGSGVPAFSWTGNASSVPFSRDIKGLGMGGLRFDFTIETPEPVETTADSEPTEDAASTESLDSVPLRRSAAAPTLSAAANAASKTVTWNASDITDARDSFTKDGITITAQMIDDEDKNFAGPGTFTTASGKFTKIEVTARYVGISGTGWSGSDSKKTWTGDASSSVSYSDDIMDMGRGQLKIVFTIEPDAVAVTGVSLNKTSTTLTVGGTETLTATVEPSNANNTVSWSSTNPDVARVSGGVVTAVAPGTVSIFATATNGTEATSDDFTATCTVTVNAAAPTVTISPAIAGTVATTWEGANWILTATANDGYKFKEWTYTQDGSSFRNNINPGTQSQLGTISSITANFVGTITITDGTATRKANGRDYQLYIGSHINYNTGTVITITANAPETGKVFDKWTTTTEGLTFASETSATTTFTMPDKPVVITATYKADLPPVTITAENKEVTYSADGITIPVDGMFTITEGAGAATYTVENGTGEGTYDAQTGKLTVTKCGTFTVKASTAATDTHAAGAETTATLTVKKADPTVTAPTAKTLTYTGSAQALVNAGSVTGGTLYYAVTAENTAPTDENLYTTSIPTATEAGTYYVWYKVVGDANHNDTEAACVTSMIRGEISQTVTFKVVNGSWDDGTTADKTVTLTGYEGDTLKLAANQIPAVGSKPSDTYKAGGWDVVPSTETTITEATTYTYTYAAKDSISQTVTFKVVNGSWDDGNTADITVTLTGSEGDTLKLAANQIPAVGSKPNDTYKVGSWDITPSTDTAITAATTYTYTYAAKEASVVTKAPEAKTLTYNGSAQELVTAGEATGGEMQYALGTATEATEAYTASIPTATDVGTYYVWYMVKGDATHTDSTPGCVEVTVRMLTVTFEVNGGSAVDPLHVVSGTTVNPPKAPSKAGYAFDGWYEDATLSVPYDFAQPLTADVTLYAKWTPNVYQMTAVYGATTDANHVWYKQSGTDTVTNNNTGVEITVKLTNGPDDSFDHFTGVQLDGVTLTRDVDYAARAGSTVVTLFPATLRRLSVGAHTVTILYDNGSVNTRLTVRQPSKTPSTGDQSHTALWITVLTVSVLGMAAVTAASKKRRSAKH